MKHKHSKFKTVLADPPWSGVGAEHHYPTMPLDAIAAMPVRSLVEDNAALYLWCTQTTVQAAYAVAEAWGFRGKTLITWVKDRKGRGRPFRHSTEFLLYAVRGKQAEPEYRNQGTQLHGPVREHSHKPEEQFALIERVSPGPYLELFARRRPASNRDWSVWGNEIASDIDLPGYPIPPSPQVGRS
jgi:N6-adenosine-specific RNA methylase IME4